MLEQPETQIPDSSPVTDEPGWQVLDPTGAVVDSGPGVTLTAVALAGEGE